MKNLSIQSDVSRTCRFVTGIAAAFFVLGGSALGQQPGGQSTIKSVPIYWFRAISMAISDLKHRAHSTKCYELDVTSSDGYIFVNFTPGKIPASVSLRGSPPGCGPGIYYKMTSSGKVISRIYTR